MSLGSIYVWGMVVSFIVYLIITGVAAFSDPYEHEVDLFEPFAFLMAIIIWPLVVLYGVYAVWTITRKRMF